MLPKPEDILPHRPPFLFLDAVTLCTDELVEAVRTFEPTEAFFAGHFPEHPIVPGVILVEAMAQALAYWRLHTQGNTKILLAGVDKARFRKPVSPGDEVVFKVWPGSARLGVLKANAEAHVNGVLVAQAKLSGAFGRDVI